METDAYKLRRDLRRYRLLMASLGDPLGLLILDGLASEARDGLRALEQQKAKRQDCTGEAVPH
jgi:hypothetical protein